MKRIFHLLIFSTVFSGALKAQDFSKFFVLGPANPFAGTSFISSHELKDSTGFLILGDKYTSYRTGFVIKTDTNLNEVWTTVLNFQNAQFPYDNISFLDIGELLNGNIYVYGAAGPGATAPHYVLFVLDAAGQVINHTALYDSIGSVNGANINAPKLGDDSTIIIPISSYDEFGYYRLDQNLNLLSYASYVPPNTNLARGRDCTMLLDSNMLVHSSIGLTKTDLSGNIIWSKEYSGVIQFFSVLETSSGSIYASTSTSSAPVNAAIAKFDAAGNPVFLKSYNMTPFVNTSPAWQIYEHGNDLMVYSDSVMFRIDTNGNVIGMGKTVDAYNNKILKPALDNKFILTGQIMQDSIGWYEYSLMKFDDSTVSGCLRPRALITTSGTMNAANVTPTLQPSQVIRDTIIFVSNFVNLDFDALNGCPPNPLGVEVQEEESVFSIYPNPCDGEITLQNLIPGERVIVANALGQLMFGQTSTGVQEKIPTHNWSEGIYFISLPDREQSSSLMFAVAH
jgi:hypothetical protein